MPCIGQRANPWVPDMDKDVAGLGQLKLQRLIPCMLSFAGLVRSADHYHPAPSVEADAIVIQGRRAQDSTWGRSVPLQGTGGAMLT